jgi:hypothetical protein
MNKNIYDFMTKKQNLLPLLFLITFILIILTSTTFLTRSEPNFSPTCGDDLCESGETEFSCPLDCSWPAFDNKTKAIFVFGPTPMSTNETFVNKLLSVGMNTIISHGNAEAHVRWFNFSQYNKTHMPPAITNYSTWSLSKGYKYHVGVAFDYNVSNLQPHGYQFENAVTDDGQILEEISPWSEDYWNNLTEIVVRLAEFGNTTNNRIRGVWFDFELYTLSGSKYWDESWGFENSTWWAFLDYMSITDPAWINCLYQDRVWRLYAYEYDDEYYSYLHNLMFTRARNMKDRVRAVNPNFLLGGYPSPQGGAYLEDIYAGWSYPESPTIVWATDSYGYFNLPSTLNNSALINNKYYNLTSTYNKEAYGYYVAGLLMRMSTYNYKNFSQVAKLGNATNGYWIYSSLPLSSKCENLIGDEKESRLPINCESDSRNPGCCINNANLPDSNWTAECCPFYPQTVEKTWQAINTTNHQISGDYSCSNNIQDGFEEGVDCGGLCSVCICFNKTLSNCTILSFPKIMKGMWFNKNEPVNKMQYALSKGINTFIQNYGAFQHFEQAGIEGQNLQYMQNAASFAKTNNVNYIPTMKFIKSWTPSSGNNREIFYNYSEGVLRESSLIAPLDRAYWKNMTKIIKQVAQIPINNPSYRIDGLLYEFELYGHYDEDFTYYTNESSYDDETFEEFYNSLTNPPSPPASWQERRNWLVSHEFLNVYHSFVQTKAELLSRQLIQEVNNINPNFYIADYPGPGWRSLYNSPPTNLYINPIFFNFYKGWSYSHIPVIFSYNAANGVNPLPDKFKRMSNGYFSLERNDNDENFMIYYTEAFVPGQWAATKSTSTVSPSILYDLIKVGLRSNGYWEWEHYKIDPANDCYNLGVYYYRLRTHCATEPYVEPPESNCCYNQYNMALDSWRANCCYDYSTTINDYWNAIEQINSLLDLHPECSDNIDNDIDNKTDYPNDPGCESPEDNSEYSDPDSWWKIKGVFDIGYNVNKTHFIVENTTTAINQAAALGFNILHTYGGGDYERFLLNKSNPAGALIRKYKMKLLVQLYADAGVVQYPLNETDTNVSFIVRNKSAYYFDVLSNQYYTNSSNKTVWIDDECIKFDSYTVSPEFYLQSWNPVKRATLQGVIRGYCSPAATHNPGTIGVNKEYTASKVQILNSPELSDAIWGYWAMDDSPLSPDNFILDFRGMQKIKYELVGSSNNPKPLVYGYGIIYGISNYTYVDKIGLYIYPWRGQADDWANYTNLITDSYNLINNLVNNTNPNFETVPLAQTFGTWRCRNPTEEELRKEIVLHRSLGAESVLFYNKYGIDNNSYSFEVELTNENWGPILLGVPLGSLTSSFTTQIIADKKVAFNASTSSPGHGPILNYSWDFGDGTNLSTADEYIEHQYATEGTFLVTLNISNYVLGESAITSLNIQNFQSPPPEEDDDDESDDDSEQEPCTPNWTCSNWSPCINNTQKITCTDTNHCGTLSGKPNTIRSCNPDQLVSPEDNETENQNQTDDNKNNLLETKLPKIFIYSLLGAIIIIGITIMILLRKSLFHLEQKEKEAIQLAKKSFR